MLRRLVGWCGYGREIQPIPPVQSTKNEIGACEMKIGVFLGGFKYGIFQALLPRVSAWLMAVALVAGLVLVLVCRGGKVPQALVLVCGGTAC